jgi:hypothetical protein
LTRCVPSAFFFLSRNTVPPRITSSKRTRSGINGAVSGQPSAISFLE